MDVNRMNLGGGQKKGPNTGSVSRQNLEEFAQFLAQRLPVESCIFKGGFIFGELTGVTRYTVDIDMTIVSVNTYDMLKSLFEEFGQWKMKEGCIDHWLIKPEVVEGASGGVTYYKGDVIVFSADIAIEGPKLDTILFDIRNLGTVRISSPEQIFADKVSVLFSQKRFRRVKDLFDAYILLSKCDLNVEKIKTLLDARGQWPLPEDKYPFTEERLVQLAHAYDKYRLMNVDGTSMEKPEFGQVVQVISRALLVLMGEYHG